MKTAVDGLSLDDGMYQLKTPHTLNNRLIVSSYKKGQLRAKVVNGFASVEQKVALQGLRVLADAKLTDGTFIAKGSIAYVKEEVLHTQQWAQKLLECDALEGQFLIVEIGFVELVTPPNYEAKS